MDDVVDLVVFDEFAVLCIVADIQLLKATWEVKLLLGDICGHYILAAELLAQGSDKWHTNLALTASHKYSALLPWNHFLELWLGFW